MPLPFPQRCLAWLKRLSENEWHSLVLGSIGLTLMLITMAWSITWQRLEAEASLVRRNAQVQHENLATIISENLTQILDRGRLMSISANEWFEGNRTDATNRLSAMRMADPVFLRIALYNRDLRRVYTSSPARDAPALKELLSKKFTAPDPGRNDMVAFAPGPQSPEQAWQLPLLYPIRGHAGRLNGILLVELDLGYFLGLYQNIDMGRTGVIEILKKNGESLAEARQAGLVLPSSARSTPPDPGNLPQGSQIAPRFEEGLPHLSSFQKLANYPFVVAISRELDETLTDHRRIKTRFFAVLLLLSTLIILAMGWVIRSLRRQARLFAALARADEEKRGLIAQLEEEKLSAFKLAAHDHLTGLPNRRMFNELATSHLARARRSRKYFALLYLDLDRFKSINDTLGHHVGDLLLQTVADRLSAVLRESDLVARLGGDEFAVLLNDLDSIEDSAQIAAKIIDRLSAPCLNLDGNDLQVGTSIGIAIFPRDGHQFETLCRNADAAMYQSKRGGRGCYRYYDPGLNRMDERRFGLAQQLSKAIAANELRLHFQPTVQLSDYRIVGFEALVRWQHPEFGLLYPKEFLIQAEHGGLINALGDWVAEACCAELAAWKNLGLNSVPIALNLFAGQLADQTLPARLAAIMAAHKVGGELLQIEISERCLFAFSDMASPVIHQLKQLGISIAVDDFGHGLSNLEEIRSLPICCLKIDPHFVCALRNSPDDAATVASIISLAHNLRMRVVAKGVELLDQLVHLKTAGCDEAQGYYLSRAISGEQARQLLQAPTLLPACTNDTPSFA